MSKRKKYWTSVHDELINQYNTTTDYEVKSKIYSKLRPTILNLIKGILYTYFIGYFKEDQEKDIVDGAEFFLMDKKMIDRIKEPKTSYAYLGTSIKHYYQDIFQRLTYRNLDSESLYDEEMNLRHDIEKEESFEYHIEEVIDHLQSMKIEKYNSKTLCMLIDTLIECLKDTPMDYLSKKYITYFLLKKTPMMGFVTLKSHMNDLRLGRIINRKHDRSYYEKLKKDKNFSDDVSLMKYLYEESLTNNEKENYNLRYTKTKSRERKFEIPDQERAKNQKRLMRIRY